MQENREFHQIITQKKEFFSIGCGKASRNFDKRSKENEFCQKNCWNKKKILSLCHRKLMRISPNNREKTSLNL